MARAKEDGTTARSEAARSRAEAEFEHDRNVRLSSSFDMERQHVEGLMASNAKYQALITETERRLQAAQSQADEAQDAVCGNTYVLPLWHCPIPPSCFCLHSHVHSHHTLF